MDYYEYLKAGGSIPEWPYPVEYGEHTREETDVLIVGGGENFCRKMLFC